MSSCNPENKRVILVGLGVDFLMFFLFAWPALMLLSGIYSTEDDYSHGLIVPFMSAYATYQIWKQTDPQVFRPSWIGLPLFAFGILIVVGGHWYNLALIPGGLGVGFIQSLGLIICIIGGYIIFGGLSIMHIFVFPIAYFIFAVPFPKSLTLPLTLSLRTLVSAASENVISAIGILVYREGNVLHLANVSLGVEDACSGIRSFWMLMAIAAALAYMIRMGLIETLLLCLLTMPISIIMNIMRVVLTGILVHNFGVGYASGWRHEMCGWLSFIGGLGLVFSVGCLFAPEGGEVEDDSHFDLKQLTAKLLKSTDRMPTREFSFLLVITGLMFACGASANFIIKQHYKLVEDASYFDRKALAEFPDEIGSFFKVGEGEIGEPALDVLEPSDHLVRYYRDDNGTIVELRIIYWNPEQYRDKQEDNDISAGVDGHIPDRCFPSWGYERLKEHDVDIASDYIAGRPVSIRLFRKSGFDRCVLFWYDAREHILSDINMDIKWRAMKMYESWNQPFNQEHASQYIVTIVVDVKKSANTARGTAIKFARGVSALLPDYGMQ